MVKQFADADKSVKIRINRTENPALITAFAICLKSGVVLFLMNTLPSVFAKSITSPRYPRKLTLAFLSKICFVPPEFG